MFDKSIFGSCPHKGKYIFEKQKHNDKSKLSILRMLPIAILLER